MRFWPKSRPRNAVSGITMTFAMMKPVDTHVISSTVAPSEPRRWGVATFTIDASIVPMSVPKVTERATSHLFGGAFVAIGRASSIGAVPTLRIVSVNDVYSLENLPRLKNLVRHFRAAPGANAVLVVLAGDFVAPSLLSSLDAGRGMIDCMNDIGFTHVVLGNHEDDVPMVELEQRVKELK